MNKGAKFIVLTGVTRGLGRAVLDEFIAAGNIVAGCGRNAEAIAELRDKYPASNRFDVVDVTSDASVSAWAKSVLASHGAPDLLMNNAAVINRAAPLWEITAPEFDQLTAVNINGVANVIRHFVPAMIARGAGVIANFSSGWGQSTSPDVAPYCASKYAIEGLTHALAQELPAGLAAVPVNPGIIDTEMLQSCFGDAAHGYQSPQEWAQKAAKFFLALGPRHNGHSLSVDAGAN
jgi:NAD(P)-dependent dehydrogenase (short-subunit alcohol dehydrogenase family)